VDEARGKLDPTLSRNGMDLEPTENRTKIFGLEMRHADAVFILFAAVFLYLHLFILPATPIYYEMDHVALMNDAKRMVDGEVIYRDFFEFVFPGSHVLYAAFIKLFGPKYWISNFLILAHGVASTAICLAFGRKVIGQNVYSYLPAAIYLFLGFRWFGIDGEHRMFSPVFGYLAVLVLLNGRTLPRIASAGIFCALAGFFTQQRGILAVGAIGVFLIYEVGIREREWKRMLLAGIVLGGSFAASLSLLILPFIVMAGPETFYHSTISFLSNYVQDPETNSLQTYFGTIVKLSGIGMLMTAIAVFYQLLIPLIYVVTAGFLVRNNRRGKLDSNVLLICLMGVFLALGTLAPNAGRLFQIVVPGLVLLGWIIFQVSPRSGVFIRMALTGLIIFGIGQAIRIQTAWDVLILNAPSGKLAFLSPVMLERYQWLSEHTHPGDYVYETYNSHINFPLSLRNPSRISILLNSGYTPPEQVSQAISDLKSKNVRYIIWDGTWTTEMEKLRDDEKLKPFYLYLIENFELRQGFTPYDRREREIWEKKDSRSVQDP
jgi:hypothetical protein